ncbi:hypothetical protein ANO14919_107420 [Xylariales sp. No.14919]|nr:hypothetical protein ANO14919_107420 [Xylariales sp. No.14919]
MSGLPSTMRALVAPKYCAPSQYEVIDLPLPTIKNPNEILIRVYAAGLQTGDTQRAKGASRILPGKMKFPMKIGVEGVSSRHQPPPLICYAVLNRPCISPAW